MIRFAIVLACTGCVVAEKKVEPDLACNGVAQTMIPASVTITGTVRTLSGDELLAGATVEAFVSDLSQTPTTTNVRGEFSYSHETANVVHSEYLHVSLDGFLEGYTFPSLPIGKDTFVDVRMLKQAQAADLAMNAPVPVDLMKGNVLMRVVDCNDSALAGATVQSSPPGDVAYFELGMPSPTATLTDASGLVLVANVMPGNVTISGSLGDLTLATHDVIAMPNTFVQTELQP